MNLCGPSTVGLRERKKIATRGRICQAVLDLVGLRAFDQVTVEEIAARADVSPRTFSNYFQSKEAALCAVLADWAAQLERRLLDAPEDLPAWRALEEAVTGTVASFGLAIDRRTIRLIVSMDHASVGQERMRTFVDMEQRLTAHVARRLDVDSARDVLPHLLVGAAVTALRVAVTVWSTTEPEVPLLELTRRCLDRLGQGLSASGQGLALAPVTSASASL